MFKLVWNATTNNYSVDVLSPNSCLFHCRYTIHMQCYIHKRHYSQQIVLFHSVKSENVLNGYWLWAKRLQRWQWHTLHEMWKCMHCWLTLRYPIIISRCPSLLECNYKWEPCESHSKIFIWYQSHWQKINVLKDSACTESRRCWKNLDPSSKQWLTTNTGAGRINWSGSSTEILFPLITEFVMKRLLSIVLLFST